MKIEIKSGFQRGGSLLQWDGANLTPVRRAGENTHQDDGDSSFSVDVPADFRGVVTRFHGVSWATFVTNCEPIGFTSEELAAIAPVTGWHCAPISVRAETDDRVGTFGQWLTALAVGGFQSDAEIFSKGGEVHPVSGEVLHHRGFSWGDQAADGWLVFSRKGEFLRSEFGCGDNTPEPVQGKTGWEFTSQREIRDEESHREFIQASRLADICQVRLEDLDTVAQESAWEDECLALEEKLA